MLPLGEILLALPRSLGFGRPFWDAVLERWRGFGLLHLHLAVALALVPPTLRVCLDYYAFADERGAALAAAFPKILVHDGRVRSPETARWVDPQDGHTILLVDTTVRRPPGPDEAALLTAEALWVQSPIGPQRFSLEGLTFLLDAEALQGWLDSLRLWLPPLFYASGFVLSACWRMALAYLVHAPFSYALRRGIGFGARARLAAVAQTGGLAVGALGLGLGMPAVPTLILASLAPLAWLARALRPPVKTA